jgi:hypothetical protein
MGCADLLGQFVPPKLQNEFFESRRVTLVFLRGHVHYIGNPPECGTNEGHMDELVGRLVTKVGVTREVAERAVGIILQFLLKEGPPEKVQALMRQLPGAEALLQSAPEESGGMFDMGGVMGAGTKMMAAGLSMGQVQSVTREVIAYTREKAGEDTVGEVVGAIPGLGQFV